MAGRSVAAGGDPPGGGRPQDRPPWEIYTVKDDAPEYGTDAVVTAMSSCATVDERAASCSGTSAAQGTAR